MGIGPDELSEVEGDVACFLGALGTDWEASVPVRVVQACQRATGRLPRFCRDREEGSIAGDEIRLRRGMLPARGRWVLGHELGHWWYQRQALQPLNLEARCDAFGAVLLAPRAAFRAALRESGHAVHTLAAAFGITQSVALLRIGEVSGRPVTLLRWPEPIVRGDAFAWPSTSELVRMLRDRRSGIHPLRITDEPGKWGLMATG